MDFRLFLCELAAPFLVRNDEYRAEGKSRVKQERSAILDGNGKPRNESAPPPPSLRTGTWAQVPVSPFINSATWSNVFFVFLNNLTLPPGLIFPHLYHLKKVLPILQGSCENSMESGV